MSITKPRRVLVTGLSGFTGGYVRDALVAAGHEVAVPPARLDLTDPPALREVIAATEFDDVIHLAAIAFVGHDDASDFYRVNTVGTTALLDAIAASGRVIDRIVLASSANIYGNNPHSPIEEDAPPAPVNHYAASKAAMELMARQWSARLPIIVTRPFNYTGVGQHGQFLIPKIVDHFRGRRSRIELGNIDVIRDFSDVRDVASAYAGLLDAPAGAVVNICSGVGISLRSVIDYCSRATGHAIEVCVNSAFVRPDEIHQLIGSNERLTATLGPMPRAPFERTLDWMLEAETA